MDFTEETVTLQHNEIITKEKVVEVHTFRIGAEEFNDDNDNQ